MLPAMAISADHVSIIAFQLMWESLSACPCGTTYGPCQHCMNYSDICEQLLRNHFCLPERGKKHQAHWALLVPHWGSLQTLLMPWVPFCMCPLGLDHTGTGVFSIWSQNIFWCFDEVAVHGLMKVLEGKAFSFGLVLCRQMQTPPSSSCFFKKLCKSCFWS